MALRLSNWVETYHKPEEGRIAKASYSSEVPRRSSLLFLVFKTPSVPIMTLATIEPIPNLLSDLFAWLTNQLFSCSKCMLNKTGSNVLNVRLQL